MAAGDFLFELDVWGFDPQTGSSGNATPDQIATTLQPCLDFDTAADEDAYWSRVMPEHYDDGGVTIKVGVAMDATNTTATDNLEFEFSWQRNESGVNLTTSAFATAQPMTIVPDLTANEIAYGTLNMSHSEIDSVQAGENFRMRMLRDVSVSQDPLGDAQVVSIHVYEQV